MSAGTPAWEKIVHQRLVENNELRKRAGLEPRNEGVVDLAGLAAELYSENQSLKEGLIAEVKCKICAEVFSAKSLSGAKAKLGAHVRKGHAGPEVVSENETIAPEPEEEVVIPETKTLPDPEEEVVIPEVVEDPS